MKPTAGATEMIRLAVAMRAEGLTPIAIGRVLGVSRERATSLVHYQGQRQGGPKPRHQRPVTDPAPPATETAQIAPE
jgi:hypothetical protein